jgi:hypothetical protein
MTVTHAYFNWPVYGLASACKSAALADILTELTWSHAERCEPYRKILQAYGYAEGRHFRVEEVPFLPVRLFKEYELSSVPPDRKFKVLTSSGTTSQKVSRIVLDRETSAAQTRALVQILQHFLGKARLPMLIIDYPGVIGDRKMFSARGAGILGMSAFGRDHTYALKDGTMMPDIAGIESFMDRHRGERVLLFGFTFMIWKYFYQVMKDFRELASFEQAILVHSGGWKKLQDEAVDNGVFKQALNAAFSIGTVHNFYGMVEQVGSIFMECEHGRLHTPAFAEVLIRDARDWSVLPAGRPGLIQVLSTLPRSYPGHSLLTEDIGEWTGLDDCPCGRLGRTFHVHGRIARAELRGCSDTHAADVHNQTEAGI